MFRLLRYFSITSLIAFLIVTALLGSFYRKTALRDLIEFEENKNVALTQAFSNSLWPQFAPFVTSVSGLRGEELRALPETARLRQAVVAQMDGLSVVKVKIYNLEGLTVFSTEASQIGEDKSTNAGYLSARSGNVASELTHRDTFSAFESTIEDRDVLSSYVPIRPGGPTGPVEGVFELYTDVTSLLERIKLTERNVVVEVSLILTSLYAVLFFLVRHADNVIRRQHIERNRAEAALQRARDELEKIVAERTAQLRTIGDDLRLELGEREQADEALRQSEERYRSIFETAAVAIWEEDFSEIKAALDELRAQGVTDFAGYLDEHPEFIPQAAQMVKVRDVNDTTLRMLGAKSKSELLGSLDKVFVPETLEIFREELIALSEGRTYFEGETINLTLQGEPRNLWLTMALPTEREKFGSVLVSIMDITARKQRERELEAFASLSAAMRAAHTRAEMFPLVLDQAIELLNADGASISLSDPASGDIVIELGRGGGAKFTQRRIPQGEGVTGRVIASGQPYVTSDAQHDPNFLWPHLLGDLNAVACVPLIAQGQTIGAMWVGHTREITSDEVRLLTAIADMAANAIHRATLHEQTEQRLKRLAALRTVDTAISASLDLRVTLNVLLDQVISLLRVDAADVLLLNPHTHLLEHAAGRGFLNPAIAQARQRLGDGNAGRAALERRTLHVPLLRETRPAPTRTGLLTGEGFLAYYAVPLIAKGQVRGVLEILHRTALDPDPEWLEFLETLAGQAAIAIDNASLFDNLERTNTDLTMAYDTTLEGWARALELRDKETEGHTRRVAEMTERLARAMGMSESEMLHVRRGALLHDIGKMGIPDHILLKPGPLTEEEWVIMRRHPVLAYDLLSPIAYLRPALDIPSHHHEKWDGTGYPRGLKGEQIPLAARIFAVVDVWDALCSDRPYRSGWPEEKVMDHIRQQAGKHFDPAVVEHFLAENEDHPVPSPIGQA